ncbi:hypothetical protein JM18_003936 [Phytophthora kernoviae]|uniref:Uncharacterized protein n=2 Tax=Phytophthora kernoviae TaxID=325452 RepID=A0A8T0LW58_9STRA|nr:hypothetical protein G195_003558 [Phytophthora kernoviae 00238/432]KAG2522272.1 hypothetical protein JM16_002216 [Phytophthora kernoviae]KAG2522863.1 hypothetical protein JM18_003936 [Phytophthora kernoviae]
MATRPIPISGNGSQRGSPITHSPNNTSLVAHSLPADMHHVHLSRFMMSASGARSNALQPPRAPLVGSMPEPNFMQLDGMPDLSLPPPAEAVEASPPRAPAVVQFANSCPGDIGFLRQGNPMRGSWTPSLHPHPAEHEDFDLSKSPALAAMSALRDGRPPAGESSATTQSNGLAYRSFSSSNAPVTTPTRHYYASDESSTYAVSAELLERLSITSEEEEEDAEDREERYRMQGYDQQIPADQRRRSDRRGSYGSMSDGGDTGIFEFDQ